MKKLLFIVFAIAVINRVADTYRDTNGAYHIDYDLAYVGGDVPDGFLDTTVRVNIDSTTALGSIPTSAASQIRADATSKGFTIPAGKVLMPTYSGI